MCDKYFYGLFKKKNAIIKTVTNGKWKEKMSRSTYKKISVQY